MLSILHKRNARRGGVKIRFRPLPEKLVSTCLGYDICTGLYVAWIVFKIDFKGSDLPQLLRFFFNIKLTYHHYNLSLKNLKVEEKD